MNVSITIYNLLTDVAGNDPTNLEVSTIGRIIPCNSIHCDHSFPLEHGNTYSVVSFVSQGFVSKKSQQIGLCKRIAVSGCFGSPICIRNPRFRAMSDTFPTQFCNVATVPNDLMISILWIW